MITDTAINFRQYTRSEVEAMSESEKVSYILELQETILLLCGLCHALEARSQNVEQRFKELEARLNQNSANSSKPPSSDVFVKRPVKNLREKSGRKRGGQPGHQGSTLRQVETPDQVEKHAPAPCLCGHVFNGEEPKRIERHQVFDIPEPRVLVTEHQIEVCDCPNCGRVCKGILPPGVSTAPAQYGPGVLALAVYLRVYQFLPYERISQLCATVFGLALSKATIEAAEMRTDGELGPFIEALKTALKDEPVLHADETGVRVEEDTRWLHVLATAKLTLYQVHDKRGGEAMDAHEVLPEFNGTLIHDCWKPYFNYPCTHGLCNAHLLRELKFAHEELEQPWALELFEFLMYAYDLVNEHDGVPFSSVALASITTMYDDILARGQAQLPPDPPKTGLRGRTKKSKARNLHERLITRRDNVLLFVREPQVPFTNNIAEQAVRMAKVQQKISGCMRTFTGAQRFARLRSYVSTVIKQGGNVLGHIVAAIAGTPSITPLKVEPG